MKKNQTTYAYPIDHICGKISKKSKVVHACTASGKQITYLQGQRDLNAHPITNDEIAAKDLFTRRQAVAQARIARNSPSYATDMANYRAQYEEGIQSWPKYIWSLVKTQIPE